MTEQNYQWIPVTHRDKRCTAKLSIAYVADKGVPQDCRSRACIEFDGAPLCKKHAARAALKVLAGEEPPLPSLPPL